MHHFSKFVLCLALLSYKQVLGQSGIVVESDYCGISPSHTICQFSGVGQSCGSRGVLSNGVSPSEQLLIVDLHNQLRSKVATGQEFRGSPGPQKHAANMAELTWDNELAKIAQRWADQCQFGHDSDRDVIRFRVGQNVYESSEFRPGPVDWQKAIQSWYDEVALVNNAIVDSYQFLPSTGHYTQIVWGSTTRIGCGSASYQSGRFVKKFVVCNYGEAGNLLRSPVYQPGPPCSACPGNSVCSRNYPGLCTTNPNAPVLVQNTTTIDTMRPSRPDVNDPEGFRPMTFPILDSNDISAEPQQQQTFFFSSPVITSRPVFSPRPRPVSSTFTSRPIFFRPRPTMFDRFFGFLQG